MHGRHRQNRSDDWFVCPHCGTVLPADATSCPECGSDNTTGWAEDADMWAAVPTDHVEDDEFDYDEFIAREFGDTRTRGMRVSVIVLALVALLTILLLLLSTR
jgi:hypothetical protein